MTTAATLVEELKAIDEEARARMLAPLAALAAIPDPTPAPPPHGADTAQITRTIAGDVKLVSGQVLEGVLVEGRILGGTAKDVTLRNVIATGGKNPPTDVPRPIIDGQNAACEGWVLEGATVEPAVRSVMWSDGVRVGRLASIKRLLVRGTVDGLAVVTPAGKRTNLDLEDFLCEDLFYSAKDPLQADGTSHNDNIQFHGPADGVKMRRLVLRAGAMGTSCIMVNAGSNGVGDFHLSDSDLSIERPTKAGVNFGPSYKPTGPIALVDDRFACPVDVYCTDALAAVLRLDRSTRSDGTPARRNRS